MGNEVTLEDWVQDLRTTDAGQAKHVLRSNDSYCCLGRLLNLLADDFWKPFSSLSSEATHSWGSGEETACLPPDILEGLEWMNEDQAEIAMTLNDEMGATFNQIADWVEEGMPVGEEWKNMTKEKE